MDLAPRYTVTRPDGIAWIRTFASPAAAWRVVIGGCNRATEARAKRAERIRAGWKVTGPQSELAAKAPPTARL